MRGASHIIVELPETDENLWIIVLIQCMIILSPQPVTAFKVQMLWLVLSSIVKLEHGGNLE